jgi:eukaryotic-like serine/threonine-protein kinase
VSFVAGELIGRVIGERFRLEALVGRGATAEVYLAVDTRLRRRVAVKVLHGGVSADTQFLRRFRSEAQLASRLTHPNVLIIHDWHDGQPDPNADGQLDPAYLITEFLDGGSLRAMLDAHRRLTLSQTALIGIEAARALTYAHGQGIVHRDIKPANLLFASDGSLRIGDFGLARAIAEAALTEPDGGLVGTARYSAPEQAKGVALDGRADVYSLVVTLIESATGESPFRADTALGVLLERQQASLVPPPEMGVLGEALIGGGVVDPAERIDAAELLRRLEKCTRGLPRPDRLPIVMTSGVRSIVDDDPTIHQSISAPLGRNPDESVKPLASHVDIQSVDIQSVDILPARSTSDEIGAVASPETPDAELVENQARPTRRRFVVGGVSAIVLAGAGVGGWRYWLTTRPQYRIVPSLVRLPSSQANSEAKLLDLAVTITDEWDENVPADHVMSQIPDSNTKVLRDSAVSVVVSRGPKPRQVPTVVGLSETEAKSSVESVQLVLRVRTRPFADGVPIGQVVTAQPVSGTLPRGGEIVVDVSAGPAPREVPNITGMTPEQAKAAMPDGLTGVIVKQSSETVAEGIVIAANYKPTTKLPKGSTVKIIVSSGPPLIKIPATKGLDVDTASKRLQAAGFVVAGVAGSPDQLVVGTRPPAGDAVLKGTEIVLLTANRGPSAPENPNNPRVNPVP